MRNLLLPVPDNTASCLPGALPYAPPAQSLYQQAFENAPTALFLMDETGLVDCNQAYLDLLGYEDKTVLFSAQFASLSPSMQTDGTASAVKASAMIALACQNKEHQFDWVYRRADGVDQSLQVTLSSTDKMGKSGKPFLFGVLRDITEQRRLEDALRETARGVSATTGDTFFRSLVEYLSRALGADYAFIGELSGEDQSSVLTTALCVNGQIVPNIEYSLQGTPCANVTSTFVNGCEVCAYPTGVQARFPEDELLVEMGVDGYVGTSLLDSTGRVVGLMVVLFRQPVRAISVVESMLQVFAARAAAELERLRAERAREQSLSALTESEERFKSAFERSAIGMAIVGLDDRYLQANQALCRLLGYSPEEMLTLTTESISHPDDLRELRKTSDKRSRLMKGEISSFQVEKRYRHKQGHYFWGLVGVSPVHDADGTLLHYITQVQDISERKQAEAERSEAINALRRANEQLEARVEERTAELERDRALLEAVLRQMPAGVMVAEAPSGRLLLGNEQMTRILRGVTDPVSGIEDLSRLAMERPDGSLYSAKEVPITRTLRTGEVVQEEETSILRGDGTRGVLLFSSAPIRDSQGQVVAAVSTSQDITSRKRTEEALRRLHNELEMQVQERTAELEQANRALQTEVQDRRRAEQVSRGQTKALARTLNALTAQTNLDTVLSHVLQAIREELQADAFCVELANEAQASLIPQLAHIGERALSEEELGASGIAPTLLADDVTWQTIVREKCPLVSYDIADDARLQHRDAIARLGMTAALVVPLLFGDAPIGFFMILNTRSRHYGPEEIELAVALAHQATLALQLAQLADQGEEAAVLKERNRLAREIHDTLAQGFAGILIHLQLAEAALTLKPDKAVPALLQARDLAKSSLAEARRSVLALRPTALDNASLPEAFRKMADMVTAGTALRCRLEVRGAPCPLADQTEEHLLRIGQEALNNTIKYAEASEVNIVLSFEEGRVLLLIRDNGVGFTLGERPRGSGFGHIGMHERLEALGGSLTVDSQPGQGTEILALVPTACTTGKNL